MIYRYGYKLRPPGPGCQPKGFTECMEYEDDNYWGFVEYEKELTEKEVKEYDLELID